jgi:surface protein
MQSLRDLNSYSRTIIEVTDTRPSGVVLDRLTEIIQDQKVTASTSIAIKVGVEIVEIVNYTQANVRYKLTINRPSPSLPSTSLSWATIPGGLTLTTAGYVYTISGIKTPAEWDIIKSPTWIVPSGYSSYPVWFVTAELIWYDSSLGRDVSVSWNIYDERYYYLATFKLVSTLTAVSTEIQRASASLTSTTTLTLLPEIYMISNATLSCSPDKQKGLYATLTAFASQVTVATTDFLTLQYTVTANESITIVLYGVTNAKVYWGDGSSNTYTTSGGAAHTYTTSGNKKVSIVGEYTGFKNSSGSLKRVFKFPSAGLTKLSGLGTRLLEIPAALPTSVRDLSECFLGFGGVNNSTNHFDLATIASWDVSRVTNMESMFSQNQAFNTSLDGWNVGLVSNMYGMFNSSIYSQPLNSWNTQNVSNFDRMFFSNTAFNQDISNWNTANAVSMQGMFSGTNFNQPINSWNVGNVTDMRYMFDNNTVFNQPLNNWNTINVILFTAMFSRSVFNQPINSWNTINAQFMDSMFAGNSTFGKTAFNQPLNNWNTSNVINMNSMFTYSVFNQNIGGWRTERVRGDTVYPLWGMRFMFAYNNNFDQNLSGWCVSNKPTKPTGFDTGTSTNWITAEKPIWGTCP